jgi:two-component system, OmpR family, phosphate regulon response regulator PhoB
LETRDAGDHELKEGFLQDVAMMQRSRQRTTVRIQRMAFVLVVDDDQDLQASLSFSLRQAGHRVQSALLGAEAVRLARENPPDLVLLDLMLPDLPGYDVCRVFKADPRTQDMPVIMLTARDGEEDRVQGFELGATDYVVKPFSTRELVHRIQIALVRREGRESRSTSDFGPIRVDRLAHRVFVGERECGLTALEFKLLLSLCERRERVLPRSKLLRIVWEDAHDSTSRTVDTHIRRVRAKLGDAGRVIETVRGVGYRFSDRPTP